MSNKNQYLQMFDTPFFNKLKKTPKRGTSGDITMDKEIKEEISWARKTLKKNDWIVWYLRLYKLSIIENHERDISWNRATKASWADTPFSKEESFKGKMAKENMNLDSHSLYDIHMTLEHMVELNISNINNMVFGWSNTSTLIEQAEDYELSWRAENEGKSTPEYGEKIVELEDGSAWFDLLKPGCSIEAEMMGHCGNNMGRDGQRVLSYRKPLDGQFSDDGEQLWIPYLTFILDTNNGELGEMKGRANSKPAERYHDCIIQLLKEEDRILKVVGGGYKASNNFSLDDLDEEKHSALMIGKPSLFRINDLYKKFGLVDKIGDYDFSKAIDEELSQNGSYIHEGEKFYIFEEKQGLKELAEDYSLENLGAYSDYIDGDSCFEQFHDGSFHDCFESECEDLLEEWCKNNPMLHDRIKHQLNQEFSEEIEENDWNISNPSDIISLCRENDLELKTALDRAVDSGHSNGAFSELLTNFDSMIKDFFQENQLSIHAVENEHYLFNIGFSKKDFFEIVKNNQSDFDYMITEDQMTEFEALKEFVETEVIEANDLNVPHYGFNDFCNDSFKSEFDNLVTEYALNLKIPEPVSEPFGQCKKTEMPQSIIDKVSSRESPSFEY